MKIERHIIISVSNTRHDAANGMYYSEERAVSEHIERRIRALLDEISDTEHRARLEGKVDYSVSVVML